MIQSNPLPHLFQTFFVSREISGSSQIDEMISCGKTIDYKPLHTDGQGSMSVAFGNRVLVTGEDVYLPRLSHEEVVELVDYDAIKNVVLAAGKISPCRETPVHWMIQKARHDIHAVVFLHDKKIGEHPLSDIPTTGKSYPLGTIESVKEILRTLREGNIIMVKDAGLLITGMTLHEIEEKGVQVLKRITL
ncbi:MAG: class II aldolase/adducin family protein [Methanobacteriota archaeon]